MKQKMTGLQSVSPQAWVVFSGRASMRWLNALKPNFRHCYVLLNDGKHWTSIDPTSSHTDVTIHDVPMDFDLPFWLKKRGLHVVAAPISRESGQAPWMVFTCVEAVKRILGLHQRWILTPWQLYRYLSKANDPAKLFAYPYAQYA